MISKLFKYYPLKNYRLTSKLMITYILLTVLPMSLLGYISYNQYTKSLEEQVGEYIPKLLDQANNNIEHQLLEMKKLPDLLYNSPSVLSILRTDVYQNKSTLYKDKFELNTYLSRSYLKGINSDILAVFVYSNNRLFYSSRVPLSGFDGEVDFLPMGKEIDSDKNLIPFYNTNLRFKDNIPFLLLRKEVMDYDNRRILGIVFIAVDTSFIDRTLKEMNDNAETWLMDKNGQVIYHSDTERIGSIYKGIENFPILNGSFKLLKDNTIVSVSESSANGWVLVHSIPTKFLTDQTDLVRDGTIIAFVAFTLISVGISIFWALNVTRPIHRLRYLMKYVERGNFDVDITVDTKDEVGMLANSFNSMVIKIRELIQKNYQTVLRQKEAELYALQSQINPHFMYNTLETINMSVEEGDTDIVVDMVTLLGKNLRYSLDNKNDVVSFKDEISHINDYLKIQKYRFEERLIYEIVESIDTEKYSTPKFILQPIVENSIKYALEKRTIAHVKITASSLNNMGL